MSETVHVQVFWGTIGFEALLESPCEGAGCHGQGKSLTAEGVIVLGELSLFVGLRHPLAELAVPQKQAFHLRGEVDVPVAGGRLWLFGRYVFACDLDNVAAKALCPVQSNGGASLPFFRAAPYPVSRTAVKICSARPRRFAPRPWNWSAGSPGMR